MASDKGEGVIRVVTITNGWFVKGWLEAQADLASGASDRVMTIYISKWLLKGPGNFSRGYCTRIAQR